MFNHTQYYVYVAKDIKAHRFCFCNMHIGTRPKRNTRRKSMFYLSIIFINSILCQKKGGGWEKKRRRRHEARQRQI
nr:hypothetical protein BSM_13770 [uncultured archaeon]